MTKLSRQQLECVTGGLLMGGPGRAVQIVNLLGKGAVVAGVFLGFDKTIKYLHSGRKQTTEQKK